MLIKFEVAGTPAEFHWNRMTGRTVLNVGDNRSQLQDPKDRSTHFQSSTTRAWKHQIDGHDVEVVKVRPLFFAPFRENHFTVSVDGAVVAESSGN
jgi:hypothetical protein